ncbi:hypothetical protein A4A49_09627 [Nicotiana attenuata]|uniref:Uncharacterized protein n=1 Tax=Nicotiana attenuata TaxID=49451 RepID=A0A1J6ITI2_NICAT|nr:hypothetical protein A4A49_09627 [Nicotiana attenuata]
MSDDQQKILVKSKLPRDIPAATALATIYKGQGVGGVKVLDSATDAGVKAKETAGQSQQITDDQAKDRVQVRKEKKAGQLFVNSGRIGAVPAQSAAQSTKPNELLEQVTNSSSKEGLDVNREEGWSSVTHKKNASAGILSQNRSAGDKHFCSTNSGGGGSAKKTTKRRG